MKSTYLSEINSRYGRDVMKLTDKLLYDAGFPLPKINEYLPGKESVHLPLNRYGIIIRIGERVDNINSDFFLKPLLEIPLSENTSFKILPSIIVGNNRGVLSKIYVSYALAKKALSWPLSERVTSNMGIINIYDRHNKIQHPVILGRGAVQHTTSPLKHIFKTCATGAPIQDHIFAPFRIPAV